uniref:Uncharacterized protein n=1 Tax=Plectus sambesii TaxID=2011161 RepID=A0A914X4G8_9BILA
MTRVGHAGRAADRRHRPLLIVRTVRPSPSEVGVIADLAGAMGSKWFDCDRLQVVAAAIADCRAVLFTGRPLMRTGTEEGGMDDRGEDHARALPLLL